MDNFIAGDTLMERAVSAFPVSIGTSLALESIFPGFQEAYDKDRKIPQQVELNKYQTFWINLSTMFRNMSSAVTKEAFLSASPKLMASTLEEEIEVIQGLFRDEGHGQCLPRFYYGTYEKIGKMNVPGLSVRQPSSESQLYFNSRMHEVIKLLERRSDEVKHFSGAVAPPGYESAFIMTHQPYDLTSFSKFSRLDLLESNTGVLKPRSLWNTKYYPIPGESMSHLPFLRKLLFIFGDKSLIKPYPISFRKKILKSSIDRRWLPTTTADKVKLDLSIDIRDPFEIAVLNSLS